VDRAWTSWKEIINESAVKVAGLKRGSRKERWISEDTWKLIDERKILKMQMEQKKRKNQTAAINYKIKDKQVKRSCKRDKQQYLERKADEAEMAAVKGDTKTLYRLVKELSSPERKSGSQ